jgi:DNA-binding transcriptional regulator GbsR (MarR family)
MCARPVEESMTNDIRRDGPPPFDRPFEGEDTKQRVYGAVLHAREPMTAAEIAERADCSAESARTHLSFYAELGIVIRHEGRPVRYERNDDYFEWRRISELARENTIDELQARVSALTDRIGEYRTEYGVDSPAEVDVLEFDAERIDDVYVELGEWATVIEERRLHERARRKTAGSTAPSHS